MKWRRHNGNMLGRRCCCHCAPAKMADTVDAPLDELVNGRADRGTVGQRDTQRDRDRYRETGRQTQQLTDCLVTLALLPLNPAAQWGRQRGQEAGGSSLCSAHYLCFLWEFSFSFKVLAALAVCVCVRSCATVSKSGADNK